MSKYSGIKNFDPMWEIDKTEYPLRKFTPQFSELSLKKYSEYHYNEVKSEISIKPWESDYVYIMNKIEKEGHIECYYGATLYGHTNIGPPSHSLGKYDQEYEKIKKIQSLWDF